MFDTDTVLYSETDMMHPRTRAACVRGLGGYLSTTTLRVVVFMVEVKRTK